mmetsp:Transcript_28191/g.39207  ORF Transcript_28191/g.39207 Transcript_28191/m.39207 type:complete len:157 (-) Transcript_28191:215-685(-)
MIRNRTFQTRRLHRDSREQPNKKDKRLTDKKGMARPVGAYNASMCRACSRDLKIRIPRVSQLPLRKKKKPAEGPTTAQKDRPSSRALATKKGVNPDTKAQRRVSMRAKTSELDALCVQEPEKPRSRSAGVQKERKSTQSSRSLVYSRKFTREVLNL